MAVTAPRLAYIEQRTTSRGLAVFGLTAAFTRKAVDAHRPITNSAPHDRDIAFVPLYLLHLEISRLSC